MNLSTLLGTSPSSLSGSKTATSQAASAVSSVPPSLEKADRRIQSDVDATTAQLSSFGLLKSAISAGQTVAHALATLSTTAAANDITKAAGNFFNVFNATVTAAKNASTGSGTTSASQSATRIIRETKTALTSDPEAQAAMKKLGMSVQADGTLVHDAKKFAAALTNDPSGVRAALATIGKQVDSVATKELASVGTVGTALTSLTQRSTTLAAQQKALKALEASMVAAQTKSASSQKATASGQFASGLAAYQTGFTGS